MLDIFTLRVAGTHAIYVTPGADLRVETVAAERGNRPWSRPRARRAGPRSTAVAAIAPESGTGVRSPDGARPDPTATQDATQDLGARPRVLARALPSPRGAAQALERPEIEDDEETTGAAFAAAVPQDARHARRPALRRQRSRSCRTRWRPGSACREADGAERGPPAPPAAWAARVSSAANEPDEAALDIHLVGPENARLVLGVGRLERDRRALLAQTLERRLLLLHERDDDVAVLGRLAAPDDDEVAVLAGVDH